MIEIHTIKADNRAQELAGLLEGIAQAVAGVIADRRPQLEAAGLSLFAYGLRHELEEVLADAADDAEGVLPA